MFVFTSYCLVVISNSGDSSPSCRCQFKTDWFIGQLGILLLALTSVVILGSKSCRTYCPFCLMTLPVVVGPHHHNYSWLQLLWDSWPYFTVSQFRELCSYSYMTNFFFLFSLYTLSMDHVENTSSISSPVVSLCPSLFLRWLLLISQASFIL